MQQQIIELKKCPSCKQPFVCKTNNIANCQCKGIIIDAESLDFISKNYSGCLCKDCLLKLVMGKQSPKFIDKQQKLKCVNNSFPLHSSEVN